MGRPRPLGSTQDDGAQGRGKCSELGLHREPAGFWGADAQGMGAPVWHPNPGSLNPGNEALLTAASIMHTETMARNSCSQGRGAEQRVWPPASSAEWRLSSIQNEGRTGC